MGMISLLCRKCKHEIPDDAVYCCYCGRKQIQERQKARGNGTGSVYQRGNHGKWIAAVVDHYYIGKNGKLTAARKTKSFDRKIDAVEALSELKKSAPEAHILTLSDLYQIYTGTKKYGKLSDSQRDKMRIAWNRLQPVQLSKISEITIETMQNTIDSAAKTYYPARDMKVLLSHLYTIAIQQGQETMNKSQYLELPDAPKAKRQVFSEEEVAKLWDDYNGQCPTGPAEAHVFTGYILVLAYTGMRVGEMYQLDMGSFHMDERYIIGGEKSEAGRDREIPIGKSIYAVVKRFYDAGAFPLKNIWKFYDDYNATLKRLEIRPYPAQTCRHTYFTMMAERHVHPALIAAMGGHAQYETAIDNYNRLPVKSKIEAADKL